MRANVFISMEWPAILHNSAKKTNAQRLLQIVGVIFLWRWLVFRRGSIAMRWKYWRCRERMFKEKVSRFR